MNNPFMTEEEKWAQAIRNQQASPAMTSQSALSPEQMAALRQATAQTQGERRKLEMQQAMANRLRGVAAPLGREVSGIYRASNPLETLGQLAQVGVGQYKANRVAEGLGDLDDRESNTALQKAVNAEIAKRDALAREDRIRGENLKIEADRFETEVGIKEQQLENSKAQLEIQRDQANNTAAKRTLKTYHDPADPSRTVTFQVDAKGNHFVGDEFIPEEAWKGLTPYSAGTAGSTAKVAAAKEEEIQKLTSDLLNADQATMVILDPALPAATGMANPERYYAQTGLPGTEETQALQTRIAGVTLDSVGPQLEKLGVNPTDRDLKEAFKTTPGLNSRPSTWIDWYENTYMPRLSSALKRANPAVHDSVMAQMKDAVDRAKVLHKIEDEEEKRGAVGSGWSFRVVE